MEGSLRELSMGVSRANGLPMNLIYSFTYLPRNNLRLARKFEKWSHGLDLNGLIFRVSRA
jgi:hypothetical protein